MTEGKKILITGGAGFIATHVAEVLAKNNEVTLLDIEPDGPVRFSPLYTDPSVRRIKGDVRIYEQVEEEVAKCDVLCHFAAILGVKKVIANAQATMDTTLWGTHNVLKAAAKHNKGIERIVNISTSEVYGNIMSAEEGAPASVGTENDPRLCYAASKLMAEHMLWAGHNDHGLPTVNVRPFNIYGPMRDAAHAAGIFVVKALFGSDVTVHGDGSQLRSWCYIDDFRDAILGCIEHEAAVGQDFNIGNPVTAITIYDLAQRIIRLADSSSKLISTPHTHSDIGVRAPNSQKARDLLGYNPKVDMEEGLLRTIAWYRDNLDLFEDWR